MLIACNYNMLIAGSCMLIACSCMFLIAGSSSMLIAGIYFYSQVQENETQIN